MTETLIPKRTTKKSAISFDSVLGFSRTWQSVVRKLDKADSLYARPPMSLEGCRAALAETMKWPRDYKRLADILFEEAKRYGVPAETTARLKLLSEGKAAVVVTGQQVGYLGGPFYTYLKAYHATRLARALEASLNFPVLPIFWLEGEDHDLEEVRGSNFLASDGSLQSVRYSPSKEIANFEVGRYEVTSKTIEHIHKIAANVNPTNAQAAEILESSYRDTTLSDAMGKLLAATLGGRGLLIVEGMNSGLKELAQPLWEKVITKGVKLAEIFDERAAELKNGDWPVPMSPTHDSFLFYVTNKEHVRYAVTYNGQIRKPDGSSEKISQEELLKRVQSGDLEISPKAALRPMYQDFVLPTIAYIGGPGELEYHAQSTPFYEKLDVTPPSLFPRLSVTLLDNKAARAVEKSGLTLEELFSEPEHQLAKKILRHADEGKTEKLFALGRFEIEKVYKDIQRDIASVDPTLEAAAQTAAGKSLHPLEQLEQKAMKALKQQHAIVLSRLEKALSATKPSGKLTERTYGTAYYLLKYGPLELLELLDSIPGDGMQHHIITTD